MKKVLKKILENFEFRCIVGVIACFAFLQYGQIRVENVILHQGENDEKTSLPISRKMNQGENFRVSFVISNPLNLHYDLNIIPDDCAESLTINGTDIPLSDYSGRCNYSKGFVLADSVTAPHRVGPRTTYELSLKNGGGPGGINVFPKGTGFTDALEIVIAILAGLTLASLCKRRKWHSFLLFCIVFGVFLRFAMFSALPYTQFANDVEGHLAYIQYITDNLAIPAADECWTCYHPPVYYTVAAPSLIASSLLGFASSAGVQLFSLALSILVLICGLAFLKSLVDGKSLVVAAALWTVWPTLLLVAPRIGNDQMFIALHVLCLLSGFNYIRYRKGSSLVFAVVCAALAIWTKSTGFISLALVILMAVAGYLKNRSPEKITPTKPEITSWILLLLIFVGLAFEKIMGEGGLVSNANSLHSGLKVGNEAGNYLYFDLKSFLMEPYTSAWANGLGREYFLNYAFKSSLFGEFKLVETALGKTLASFISVSFLGLIVFAIRGWWKTKLDVYHWILFIQGILFFAALGYLRYKYPYACSNDFRYIMPALLSFVPYVGLGVYQEEYSCKWKVLGVMAVIVFVVSSVLLMGCVFG